VACGQIPQCRSGQSFLVEAEVEILEGLLNSEPGCLDALGQYVALPVVQLIGDQQREELQMTQIILPGLSQSEIKGLVESWHLQLFQLAFQLMTDLHRVSSSVQFK
jgi:hypothetical protein